jgi:hypothetical protein
MSARNQLCNVGTQRRKCEVKIKKGTLFTVGLEAVGAMPE